MEVGLSQLFWNWMLATLELIAGLSVGLLSLFRSQNQREDTAGREEARIDNSCVTEEIEERFVDAMLDCSERLDGIVEGGHEAPEERCFRRRREYIQKCVEVDALRKRRQVLEPIPKEAVEKVRAILSMTGELSAVEEIYANAFYWANELNDPALMDLHDLQTYCKETDSEGVRNKAEEIGSSKNQTEGGSGVMTAGEEVGVSRLQYHEDMVPENFQDWFYAVSVGRVPGIYVSWIDAGRQVIGFKGAIHQKFRNLEVARDYMRNC